VAQAQRTTISSQQGQVEVTRAERLALMRSKRPFLYLDGVASNGAGVSFQVVDQSRGRLMVGSNVLLLSMGLEEDESGRQGWFVPLARVQAWEDGAPVDREERTVIAAVLGPAIEAGGTYAAIVDE